MADGGFVVTWSSFGQDGDNYGIYGKRYDENGEVVGSEFQVNTYTTGTQAWSSVTALSNGGFVVTWSSFGQDGGNYGIYGKRYNENGEAVGSEFQINTYTTLSQIYSSVTALADGGFVVTWSSNGQDGSNFGIYGQRFSAEGAKRGAEFQVSQTTAGDQFSETYYNGSYTIDTLANGQVIATWYGNGSGDTSGVYARILDFGNAPTDLSLSNNNIAENQVNALIGNLSTNDLDIGGDTYTYSIVSGFGNDTAFSISSNQLFTNGSFDYETQNTYTFRIRATDPTGLNYEKDLTINVTNVNESPVVTNPITATATEDDAPFTVNLLDNASDPDTGDTLSISNLSPTGDTSGITVSGNTLNIDPNAYNSLNTGENAVITYTYDVIDGNGGITATTATITITGVNYAPIAIDDTATAVVNIPKNISVSLLLSNDTDLDGDVLSITSISNITGGIATLNDNGTPLDNSDDFITYNPTSIGNFSLDYTVDDGNGGTDIGTVNWTVSGELLGTFGKDTLTGGNSDDIIKALADNDLIYGLGGNDTLYGGSGNDTIQGDDGNDLIRAGNGDDLLFGGAGNDTIYGGNGQDTSYGGDGDDLLYGQLGNNILVGGAGNDTLYGGSQVNQIVYLEMSDRGTAITGDQIKQFNTSQDQLIITELLDNIGYSGSNPVTDGYLRLFQAGSSTLLQIDADGGANSFVRMATLYNTIATNFVVGTNVII